MMRKTSRIFLGAIACGKQAIPALRPPVSRLSPIPADAPGMFELRL